MVQKEEWESVLLYFYLKLSEEWHTYFSTCHRYMGQYLGKDHRTLIEQPCIYQERRGQGRLHRCPTSKGECTKTVLFGGKWKGEGICLPNQNNNASEGGISVRLGWFCSLCASGRADSSRLPGLTWDITLQRLFWPRAPNSPIATLKFTFPSPFNAA